MSDEYRNRSDAGFRAGDIEWRRDADRPWDAEASRAERGRPEPRAFEDREPAQGYARPDANRPPQRHRGYRLGPYGRHAEFGAPDYVEPGRGYGGAVYENAPYERGYGDDRYSYEGRRGPASAETHRYGGADDGRRAFQGDNDRLQRVSDGQADHGHLFGGGADSHRGRGPKGYSRSDTRIHEDVADHLTADHALDASDIDVTVKDGEVTLSGHVPRRGDRRHAEDLAERVLGVKHVQNNLRVQAGPGDAPLRTGGLR